ncbi:hypothetical protein GCM10027160_23440 [Streptomyces calidiresistens]|uniref:Uncharacterized protein n=1 Tax=Streptomyces calidiresistens TaxID=1485586 RepID=A0A7W3XZ56_9ACTN|nr:hypothetical protein [Streptomyces calidiresistens]MBB0232537.1 hypothetical protein [Streptomyces calidiresistens]
MSTPAATVSSELVAVAWLLAIPGGPPAGLELPTDPADWAETGYIVVEADVAGPQNPGVPLRTSIFQLASYGANPNTLRPNWAASSGNAWRLVDACDHGEALNTPLDTRPGWARARVTGAWPQTLPRRDTEDISSYAVHRLDLAVNWVRDPTITPEPIGAPES